MPTDEIVPAIDRTEFSVCGHLIEIESGTSFASEQSMCPLDPSERPL
jgi:hypothetical protein